MKSSPATVAVAMQIIDIPKKVHYHCIMIQTMVELSSEIMLQANKYASVHTRSVSMQIEHWARIGKRAEENPDLPYAFIEDALIGKAELDNGEITPFEFQLP